MLIPLDATLFFDCDGVILQSNQIKSKAFFDVALKYASPEIASEFLIFHKNNGGMSRNRKFHYFFEEMISKQHSEKLVLEAVNSYQKIIFDQLLSCDLISGVEAFLSQTPNKKYIVSGGNQEELRKIFKLRKLDKYFENILGSPKNKFELINELNLDFKNSYIFFGDSNLDYEVASFFKMDFFFVYSDSELNNWRATLQNKLSNSKTIQFIPDFTLLTNPPL